MKKVRDTTSAVATGVSRQYGNRAEFLSFDFGFGNASHTEPQVPIPDRDSLVSRISSSKSYIRPYFRSRIVPKESIEKPWLDVPQSKWPVIIVYFGICVGLGLVGFQMYLGWASVVINKYCLVMEDNFDELSLNSSLWNYEMQLGGFG